MNGGFSALNDSPSGSKVAAMMTIEKHAAGVLAFWFDELKPADWWRTSADVDATVRERFGELHARLSDGVDPSWLGAPETALAAVIVLDQFSRNLHRGDPRAYAQDTAARALADAAIARRHDAALAPTRRAFLYMPFMHSEDAADQERSVALFAGPGLEGNRGHAEAHKAVIDRFGRFPTRNAALGRADTPEEAAYLKTQTGAV